MSQEPVKTDVNKVAEVWDGFAKKYGTDRRTSTPDAFLVDLELKVLRKYFKDGKKLLDIGCGNGYTSLQIICKRRIDVIGIDISPEMIVYANQNLEKFRGKIKGTALFKEANVLEPGFVNDMGREVFDVVLTKRVIINLLTWEEQKESIAKIWQLLKPGGTYLMIEATIQGYEKINRIREKYKLSRTPIRWHNKYIDEEKLLPFLKAKFDTVFARDFSSTYYVGSRVIQPLLLKPFNKEPDYDFFLNRFFVALPSIGNYGLQKLFICKKGK